MASHVVVEWEPEQGPSKRITVKTTPTMPLQAVLDSAVAQLKFDLNHVVQGLRYKKAWVDLSLPMRFANLPQGAKLDLITVAGPGSANDAKSGNAVPTPSATSETPFQVKVAVQLEDGKRIMLQITSAATFWDILRTVEEQSTFTINLSRREQAPSVNLSPSKRFSLKNIVKQISSSTSATVYMQPVCVVMNREFGTLEQLQTITLSSIGITKGNHAIRVLFKETDVSLADVMPLLTKEAASVVVAPLAAKVEFKPPTPNVVEPIKTILAVKQVLAEPAMNQEPSSSSSGEITTMDRDIKVYRMNSQVSPARIALPDSFFQLSAHEMNVIISLQAKHTKDLNDRPLMTRAMRDRESNERAKKYPKTMIRVRFPDMIHIQATFMTTHERISDLYAFVRSHLSDPLVDFVLYTTPPMKKFVGQEIMDSDFYTAGLAPASLLYFATVDGDLKQSSTQWVKTETLALCTDAPIHPSLQDWVPETYSQEDVKDDSQDNDKKPEQSAKSDKKRGDDDGGSNSQGRKVPAWFKMPLKK